jgi:hypothetical protein
MSSRWFSKPSWGTGRRLSPIPTSAAEIAANPNPARHVSRLPGPIQSYLISTTVRPIALQFCLHATSKHFNENVAKTLYEPGWENLTLTVPAMPGYVECS